MNRTLLLLLSVLLLGALTWLAIRDDGQATTKLSDRSEERQFGYQNIKDVHRIFVADRKGHSVTLTRGGVTGWLANGNPANENILKNLLEPVRRLEVQALPAQAAVPNMVKNLASSGILVQLFDEAGNKLRGYYLGGATNDERGTYAIVEGSESPYIVHLPHWTGNVRHRFSHWDDDWRDKVYFRVDPDNVESFSIDYPTEQSKSFRLEREGEDYILSPIYETGQPPRRVPRGIAERALVRYEKYYVNRYENGDTPAITMAKAQLPFATIRIKESGKEEQVMAVYPRFENSGEALDSKTGEKVATGGMVEAYRAFINGGEDWVLLNVETTEPLLVGYGSF